MLVSQRHKSDSPAPSFRFSVPYRIVYFSLEVENIRVGTAKQQTKDCRRETQLTLTTLPFQTYPRLEVRNMDV